MNKTFSTNGLQALFGFPFRKAGWLPKLGILGVLALLGLFIPLVPWIFAAGYLAVLLRSVVLEDGDPELPEWSNWTQLFIHGLRVFGVSLFYCVPVMLVFGFGFAVYMGSVFSAIAIGNSTQGGAAAPLILLAMGVLMTSMSCGTVLALGLGALYPAPLAHVVTEGSFAALFHVRDWWRIFRANFGGYLVVGVLFLGLMVTTQLLSQILFFILVAFLLLPVLMLVVSPYCGVIWILMIGQAYREGKELCALREAAPAEDEAGNLAPAI
jgi:hypothetical protein